MPVSAKVLLDSVSSSGSRLTTMEVVCHRFILSEFNTHRVFSRNSASSRAIPVKRRIQDVLEDPAYPMVWGKNRKGMQSSEALTIEASAASKVVWDQALQHAVKAAEDLLVLDVHKQLANRLLEPFSWHTILVSSTEWDNFFKLRCPPSLKIDLDFPAQPEMQAVAIVMKKALDGCEPIERIIHAPYAPDFDYNLTAYKWSIASIQKTRIPEALQIAVARCARVSYENQNKESDPEADYALFERLRSQGHWSPFEHVAKQTDWDVTTANFKGWEQLRWILE